jgi:hypothetical protein
MKRVFDRLAVGFATVVLLAFLLGASYYLATGFVAVMDHISDGITEDQK